MKSLKDMFHYALCQFLSFCMRVLRRIFDFFDPES